VPGGALAALLVTLATLLSLAACTDEPNPPTSAPPDDEVALELTLAKGAAGLTPKARDELLDGVSTALTTYLREGFLGDYPRDDFVRVLDAFTTDEAPRAAADLEVLTASGLEGIAQMDPRLLDASVTTFAPGGRASGASARVDFRFVATDGDGEARGLTLAGRLLLTPERGAWKIFGYDVRRNDDARVGAAG
jgi:hypothetical protein